MEYSLFPQVKTVTYMKFQYLYKLEGFNEDWMAGAADMHCCAAVLLFLFAMSVRVKG